MILHYVYAFIGIAFYAALGVIAKKMSIDIPPFTFISITMCFLFVMSVLSAMFIDKDFVVSSISPINWGWLFAFALINFIGFAFYLTAISKIPVVEYQIIGVVTPVIGGLLAYLILAEALTVRYFIGLIFIGVGLYISLKK